MATTTGAILADLFQQAGLTAGQYDVSAATDAVDGFVITQRQDVRSSIDALLQAYQTFLVEVDGKLTAVKRGAASVVTVALGDMGAQLNGGGAVSPQPHVTVKRLQELELPFALSISYFNRSRAYQQALQTATRYTKPYLNDVVTLQFPLVLPDLGAGGARQMAEMLLYQQWVERTQLTFSLPFNYFAIAPGDVLTVPVLGSTIRCRVVQIDVDLPGLITIQAVTDDVGFLTQVVPGALSLAAPNQTSDQLTTTTLVWSGPALQDQDAASVGVYIAAGPTVTGYWPGCALFWSRDSGTTYQELITVKDAAVMGTTTTLLGVPLFGTGPFDDLNTVTVSLTGTPPTSTTDSDVENGANPILIGDEVIQFGTIVSAGGSLWTLSHLLRGRRGTDWHWGEHQIGERALLLESGVVQRANLTVDLKGKEIFVKAVPSGTLLADAAALPVYVTGDEFRCYAPVQFTKSRDGSFNLTLSWVPRSRTNAEMHDGSDIASGEATLAFDACVLDGVPLVVSAVLLGTTTKVTLTGVHAYNVGDTVFLQGMVGPTALNGRTVVLTAVTGLTFTFNDNSLGMGAWSSGGTSQRIVRVLNVSLPTVIYTAAQQTTDGFTPASATYNLAIFMLGLYGRGFPLAPTAV